MKRKSSTKPQTNGTVSCHVRFPKDVFNWLAMAKGYRSVQERIIELARQAQAKAQEAEESEIAAKN